MKFKISKNVLKAKVLLIVMVLFYKFICVSAVEIGAGISSGLQVKPAANAKVKDNIKYPIMEKVVIYSQKSENSDEKIIRNGLLSKPKNAKANVVLCHGYTCSKDDIGFMRYMFKDCNCLTFDFRAHGENIDGQCCTLGKNEAYDVIAAAKYIKSRPDLKDKPTIVYAFSMGAVAAIEAQAKVNSDAIIAANIPTKVKICDIGKIGCPEKSGCLFDAMILDCPFDSTENVVSRGLDNKKITIFGYPFDIPGKPILRKYLFHPYVQAFVKALLRSMEQITVKSINTFACNVCTAESIKKVTVPCLFIICKNDEKISVDNIKSIYYNAASNYKELLITGGTCHFGSFFHDPEGYADKVDKFITKVVSGQLARKNKHKIIERFPEAGQLKAEESKAGQLKAGELKVSHETAIAVKDVKLSTNLNLYKNGGKNGK